MKKNLTLSLLAMSLVSMLLISGCCEKCKECNEKITSQTIADSPGVAKAAPAPITPTFDTIVYKAEGDLKFTRNTEGSWRVTNTLNNHSINIPADDSYHKWYTFNKSSAPNIKYFVSESGASADSGVDQYHNDAVLKFQLTIVSGEPRLIGNGDVRNGTDEYGNPVYKPGKFIRYVHNVMNTPGGATQYILIKLNPSLMFYSHN